MSLPPLHLIGMPYRGERNAPEISDAPAYVLDAALHDAIAREGLDVAPPVTIELSPDEAEQYGEWHRVGLANAHLGSTVADAMNAGGLPVALLANCNALMGVLGGIQHARDPRPCTVGLIWFDAHADFNTPETTRSGMLGGMPVATSAGLCLHRLRQTSGMATPLHAANIIMAGLRDVDPLERDLLDEHAIEEITIDSLLRTGDDPPPSVRKLLDRADAVYVHVDMDVLDPQEVPGHPLTVAGGPSSERLAAAVHGLFTHPQVVALGIASAPPAPLDREGRAKAAAHRLIIAAAGGFARRVQWRQS